MTQMAAMPLNWLENIIRSKNTSLPVCPPVEAQIVFLTIVLPN